MSAKLTKAEVDEIEKFCENSPTWTLERVPRLIAHVRAQDDGLALIWKLVREVKTTDGPSSIKLIQIENIACAARMEEK